MLRVVTPTPKRAEGSFHPNSRLFQSASSAISLRACARLRSPGSLDCIRIQSHLQESSGFGCNHAPALQRGRSHHHAPNLIDQLRALVGCTVVAHPGHRYLQTRSHRFSFASAVQRPTAHRLRGGVLEQRVQLTRGIHSLYSTIF